MTTGKAYIDFVESLKTIYDEREANNIADWVFEKVTGLKKIDRRPNRDKEIDQTDFYQLQDHLAELLAHKPVQYVLHEAWFYKMRFYVDENVLIPRPETEELVEWILKDASTKPINSKPINIIDIGTGSGCIAISLKKELNYSRITAIDTSEKALETAKKNSSELKADVDFIQLDFLDKGDWKFLKKYDIIVSNPPYIPLQEKESMSKNVTGYEPGMALFVENHNPFIFYKKIVEFAKSHLNPNGKIYVEVHENYAADVKKSFEKAGFNSLIKKDIYGKDRMVKAF